MRKVIIASLLAAAMGTVAQAQDPEPQASASDVFRARDIVGNDIYTTNESSEGAWDWEGDPARIGDGWDDIGEIADLVINGDGRLVGVVAEVGGFLDIGDKQVILPVENIRLQEGEEGMIYVTRYTREELESLPGIEEGFWQ